MMLLLHRLLILLPSWAFIYTIFNFVTVYILFAVSRSVFQHAKKNTSNCTLWERQNCRRPCCHTKPLGYADCNSRDDEVIEEILEILPAKCQKDDGKDLSVSSDISFNGEIADTISETNDDVSL